MQEAYRSNGRSSPLDEAKGRVREASRRPAPPPPGASPRRVAGEMSRENPGGTASVIFALAATLGPGRLIKGGLLAWRIASAVKLARTMSAEGSRARPRRTPAPREMTVQGRFADRG
ncbi:MAG: hypothetical protein ACIARR_10010 [Phycisphaerales bacterium JB059]